MQCGFNILYGFTQSDEISLLLHPDDDTFARKTRKLDLGACGRSERLLYPPARTNGHL